MIMTCHHIGIFTEDPQPLVEFYTQGLGFVEGNTQILGPELTKTIFGIEAECRMIKLTRDSAAIELFAPLDFSLDKRTCRTTGYNHWALEVDDKEAYIRILEERNVDVIRIDRGSHLIYFVRDPEGNLIEIYEPR